jgi:hypothetical protein
MMKGCGSRAQRGVMRRRAAWLLSLPTDADLRSFTTALERALLPWAPPPAGRRRLEVSPC